MFYFLTGMRLTIFSIAMGMILAEFDIATVWVWGLRRLGKAHILVY